MNDMTEFKKFEESLRRFENEEILSTRYLLVYEYISEIAKAHEFKITEDIVREIHLLLFDEKDYRTNDIKRRDGYDYPSAEDVERLMKHFSEQLVTSRRILNDIEFISFGFKRILEIAPFEKGNDAVALSVLALLSISMGYGVMYIPEEFVREYHTSLKIARESNNTIVTPFTDVMERIFESVKQEREKIVFRKMRRKKQEITREECISILKNEKRGVLAVIGDYGYPYAVPVNFYYDENDEKIYIHGAKEGHKIDAVRNCEKVCFTVYNNGVKKDDDWAFYVTSVIVMGKAELVDDDKLTYDKTKAIGLKYYPNKEDVDKELEKYMNKVQIISIGIDHMSGKLVHEK
ncbi:MAG: pyridoxamine 5'-phosphate oxidase family protein [Firmicutes bacterium]|nr:pyridoxamine 5'-phosphate oxidase family protein [Bacillota bacterium]